jgi:hypothetical protein
LAKVTALFTTPRPQVEERQEHDPILAGGHVDHAHEVFKGRDERALLFGVAFHGLERIVLHREAGQVLGAPLPCRGQILPVAVGSIARPMGILVIEETAASRPGSSTGARHWSPAPPQDIRSHYA